MKMLCMHITIHKEMKIPVAKVPYWLPIWLHIFQMHKIGIYCIHWLYTSIRYDFWVHSYDASIGGVLLAWRKLQLLCVYIVHVQIKKCTLAHRPLGSNLPLVSSHAPVYTRSPFSTRMLSKNNYRSSYSPLGSYYCSGMSLLLQLPWPSAQRQPSWGLLLV